MYMCVCVIFTPLSPGFTWSVNVMERAGVHNVLYTQCRVANGSLQYPIFALTGDDVILPCFLKTSVSAKNMVVEWTRLNLTPENVHLYRDNRDSYEEQHPSYKGRTSLFNDELKNGNVSLKLTRVTLSDAGSYRCFIPTLKKETTVQLFVGES
uniref:Ig-like domain-containing protein n=1 Tax=Hucho hucho TaxID=62062 RepID=A0A4W5M7H3_9TELE